MKGVRCSWVDMQKIRQALSAGERGDQKALEKLRCVDHSTVSRWKATIDLLDALEGKCALTHISRFQPTHAVEITRHFRKTEGKDWSEEAKERVAEWVDRCEVEGWTVQELRQQLLRSEAKSICDQMPESGTDEPDIHEQEPEDVVPVSFNWLAEAEAIYDFLTRRREKFPTRLRQGFTDLVRRVLDRLDAEDAKGRQGVGGSEASQGVADAG